MCGRYALGVRLAYMRQQLEDRGMLVDDAPEDEDIRETFNFAPGNFGAVYRADTPDRGYDHQEAPNEGQHNEDEASKEEELEKKKDASGNIKYKIQSMKWGLVPFWTKRAQDYGSMMRTINCRDDSLNEDRGMWTTMKRRKRCIVICQGFYEWLKKGPGGKEKVPHFVKRKDGDLMFFAGLWDCVQYEGSDEKIYTYTVITTSSNPYLAFLHERMPVILEAGSEAMRTWLDPKRTTWSKELQTMLKPYEGELECYPVTKEVGKVGNNSPDFIIPVNSKENRSNIANFFNNAKKKADDHMAISDVSPKQESVSLQAKPEDDNSLETLDKKGIKREHSTPSTDEHNKKQKIVESTISPSPSKSKMRSATHNTPKKKSGPTKLTGGSQRITNFFK
ncbi:hypothetical protein N7533_009288 [Penicillium manginii]|uniref:uncharacterized protein n=1 Tax=Penicillium manginii TaxID=203109 RepID=UPI0025472B8D|nr:uncharacterized protein N7533_009288 [Penicillium manginii]KAJ5744418.1 hypothetical protein N7533_009288 [Penicillium manginii]